MLVILYTQDLEQCLAHEGLQSIFVEWMSKIMCESLHCEPCALTCSYFNMDAERSQNTLLPW